MSKSMMKRLAVQRRAAAANWRMSVAQTILEQLGGNRFVAMTGANTFIGSADSLRFSIPRARNGATLVRVTLDLDDTYIVKFFTVRGRLPHPVSEHDGVYADQLQSIFTQQTGLDTRL